jgi:hypothetical protein
MAFCPRAHRHLAQRSVGLPAVGRRPLAPGHTPATGVATGRRCTVAVTLLHQQPCCERLPIASTVSVRTV